MKQAQLQQRSGTGRLSLLVLLMALTVGACDAENGDLGQDLAEDPRPAPPAGIEPLHGPSFAQAQEAGQARIQVLYVRSSGFAAAGPDEDLTGVTVEILREFGNFVEETYGMDVTVTFEEEEHWPTFYQRVRYSEGGVFGIGNVTITEARRDELAFSPPYLDNVAILMTHEDVPELESLEEMSDAFSGMTGLLYTGTLHEERIEALRDDYFPGMATAPVGSNDGLVSRVASGEGYFGYIDVYNYWAALERGEPLRRHAVGDDASEQFGIIMPRHSDWEPVMREFFEREDGLMRSEWYRDLLDEHLGGELARLLLGGSGENGNSG